MLRRLAGAALFAAVADSQEDPKRVPRGAAADVLRAVAAAERAEAELVDCRKSLQVCQSHSTETGEVRRAQPIRSSQLQPGSTEAPDWPKGYGSLLRFPFGISDMKTLKEVARELWAPEGTAADIEDEVSSLGFRQQKGMRCSSEMVGTHPVGGVSVRWSVALWESAQQWCLESVECTGIMLYVGSNTMNCHSWCGRPQFCSGRIDAKALDGVRLQVCGGRTRATIAELQLRYEPKMPTDAQLTRSFTRCVESSLSTAKPPPRLRRKLQDIGEQRVLKAGMTRLCSQLTCGLTSQELCQLPQRTGGSQLFMTPSFYQRLLRGETELKILLEGDVAAAQSDLRHLRLEQLLSIRVATLDWATESHSHNAHTNFLMSLDTHLFERLSREFLCMAQEPAPKPALHALGLRIALVVGAGEVIAQGWGQQPVNRASGALPPVPEVWALPLGSDWTAARVALFHTRDLWLKVCSGDVQRVQEIAAGQKVAIFTDRSVGLGKDRVLHWDIAVLDPSFEDIMDEIKQQDQASAEQKRICSELTTVLKKRMSGRAKELGLAEPDEVLELALQRQAEERHGGVAMPKSSATSQEVADAPEAEPPKEFSTPERTFQHATSKAQDVTPPRPCRLSISKTTTESENKAPVLGYPAEPTKPHDEDGCFSAFLSCGRR
ncbi:ylyB [Symbiodinium pilosum]|uniref:YlyB protein n=1 Tax=Symbiodinium pilosum TaxID=2952 RepID=A0A812XP46_SYMPI|nr:ylyB [Symbiodinium pilosum]